MASDQKDGAPIVSEAGGGVHHPCHIKRFFLALALLLSCGIITAFLILSYLVSAVCPQMELGSGLPCPHSCTVVEGHGLLIAQRLGQGLLF